MKPNGHVWTDLRFAVIKWTRQPLVALIVIATFAIGVGLNTTIMGVLKAMMFQKLPYQQSKNLVLIQTQTKQNGPSDATSYTRYRAWEHGSKLLEQVGGVSQQNLLLSTNQQPELLSGELVSSSYFPVLRLNMARGRTFTPQEADDVPAHVAIISYDLWQKRFDSDHNILGKTIKLNEELFTIIGVAPSGIHGVTQKADIWIPITDIGIVSTPDLLHNDVATWVIAVGRLAPGNSLAQVKQELQAINTHFNSAHNFGNDASLRIVELQYALVEGYRTGILLMCGAAFLVLLIACANASTVLLSYFFGRSEELAVRQTFGATQSHLLQQLVIESTLLSVVGSAVGVFLAFLSADWMGKALTQAFPDAQNVEINGAVLVIVLFISILTGILVGLISGLRISRSRLSDSLREGGKSIAGFARSKERSVLTVWQLSLAMVLLVAAGLMFRTIVNLEHVSLGFYPDNVLLVRTSAIPADIPVNVEHLSQTYDSAMEQLRQYKELSSAGAITSAPLLTPSPTIPFSIHGRPLASNHQPPVLHYSAIGGQYFEALGIALIRGRTFDAQDRGKSEPVAIINETMAKQFWPDQDPVGQQVKVWEGGPERRIVGVVDDVRDSTLRAASTLQFYLPLSQIPDSFASILRSFPPTLVLKTKTDPAQFSVVARTVIHQVDPNINVLATLSMSSMVSGLIAEPKLYRDLLLVFAAIALALGSIGMYGIVAHSITQRTTEIGVRIAVGASRGNILLLLLRHAMLLALIGVAIGGVGAWGVSRVMNNMLFGVKPEDVTTYLISAFTLVITTLVACYVPARRASHIEPLRALKYE